MTFYIMLPGDTKESLMYESNLLGEDSFDSFYPAQGFEALMNLVNNSPDVLDSVTILDHTGKKYSIEDFLTKVNGMKFRRKY